jgi:hypothetical protein
MTGGAVTPFALRKAWFEVFGSLCHVGLGQTE